jgi:cyclopropane-fatty-acyl-phospholipid synthase
MQGIEAKKIIENLLHTADIEINSNQPWSIHVHNDELYARILKDGSLGFGEAYMEKWWDCQRIDLLFERLIRAGLQNKIKSDKWLLVKIAVYKIINLQSKTKALEVGRKHYDLGNDLFKNMLDNRMNYTCAYWREADNLDDAQLAKLELVCQKLMLKPGMTVLDIGCGFGSFAKYAAQNYGVTVKGITISHQQCEYAKQNCAGLPIEILFQDYREVNGRFDRIVSLGMFEHVGALNYKTYMEVVQRCLNDDGLFLLHTIGDNVTSHLVDKWIGTYIFPNGLLPSIAQIARAAEGLFVMEDWHNFGADYDRTLMAWYNNFNKNWDKLKSHYDEKFYRMWSYYLLSCAGSFRARHIQLWQIVFSKGIIGGYQAPRYSSLMNKKAETSADEITVI